ncbi:AraC family transcriptional regulator [Candidatus Fermentibacteria bacterium]|nr:AraC family transcriptional regulator [Candidatus Fermentibacteria bacterium]
MRAPSRQERLRAEYRSRINRVIDFIEFHLEEELSLHSLADVACFSPFHFHRIFGAMTGETLNQFIQRLRIERAANQLMNNPTKSITAIAFDCGFSGSAAFSRAFRQRFEMSPSRWRSGGHLEHRKMGKEDRKTGNANGKERKDFEERDSYLVVDNFNHTWRVTMSETKSVNVEVKEMPEFTVAYVRHVGPYAGDSALFERLFTRLFQWAGARDLLGRPDMRAMSVYHDDPEVTPEDKLRVSVCITVPPDTAVDGEIGRMTIPGGKFAVGHFVLSGSSEYGEAWNALMGGWLPESGYQPDDRLCYELYLNDPSHDPEGKHIVDICMPVKPL